MADDWTAADVAACFAEAANTLRGLPACERAHLIAPEPTLPLAAPKMPATGQKQPPSPESMATLQQALTWTGWLTDAERRLVWSRGAGMPWKRICADLGCDRTTAWRHWQLALTKIAGGLNAQ